MPRKADIEPRWLVGLLNRWVIHEEREQTGSLGFASGSSWMRGLKSSPSSSIDPTGYSAEDFRDLENVLTDLCENGRDLWASVMMYYRPWVIRAFQEEGFPFANTTYYDRLHRAHRLIAKELDEIRDARKAVLVRLHAVAK